MPIGAPAVQSKGAASSGLHRHHHTWLACITQDQSLSLSLSLSLFLSLFVACAPVHGILSGAYPTAAFTKLCRYVRYERNVVIP